MSKTANDNQKPGDSAASDDIGSDYDAGLLPSRHGVEADIVRMFMAILSIGRNPDEYLPLRPGVDTVLTEMSLRYGRADIVMFHADGSAGVIEVKDGTKGYNHVVSGIGQASLYAVQLYSKGAVTKVRKYLLWTSTGNPILDAVICDACEAASTTPLPWATLDKTLAVWDESDRRMRAKLAKEAA